MVKVRCPKCGTIFPPEAREVQICPRCGCAMRISKRPASSVRYPADRREDQYRPSQPPRLPERSGSGVYLSREQYEDLLYKARMRREYRDDRGYYRDGYDGFAEDYTGYPSSVDYDRDAYDYRRGYDRAPYRRGDEPREAAYQPRTAPESAPAPAPENVVTSEPTPESAPVPAPENVVTSEPTPESAPAPAPENVAASEPAPETAPAPESASASAFESVESKSETDNGTAASPFDAPSAFSPFAQPEADAYRPAPPPPAAPDIPAPAGDDESRAPEVKVKRYGKAAAAVACIILIAAGVMNALLLILGVVGEGFASLANGLDLVTAGSIGQKIVTIAVIALPVVLALFGIAGAAAHKKGLMVTVGVLLIIAFIATLLFVFIYSALGSDGTFNFMTYIQGNFSTQTVWVYIAAGLSLVGAITLFVLSAKTGKKR